MSEEKIIGGMNGQNIPHICFAVSRKQKERVSIKRIDNAIVYILFEQQKRALEEIGIYVVHGNWHHLVQKKLHRGLSLAIGREKDNKKLRMLLSLEKEISFKLANLLPIDVHEIYNRIFRNCLIPKCVIAKLSKIFCEENLGGGLKSDVIDLFTFMAILSKEISYINIEKICEMKKSQEDLNIANFIDFLDITEDEIKQNLEYLFLYPDYQKMGKHFANLFKIHDNYFKKEYC